MLATAPDLVDNGSDWPKKLVLHGVRVSTRQEDGANTPNLVFLVPNRDRHRIQHVRQRTPTRSTITSVVEPWVDMVADTHAINEGRAVHDGNTYRVNGRTYGAKISGAKSRLYPISGQGVHRLSRNEFKALGVYNDLGISPRVELILARMGISIAEQYRVRTLWQIGKDAVEGVDRD